MCNLHRDSSAFFCTFFNNKEEKNNMINAGDTAFMLVSAAMVLIMTPGLGFFYGGLGRRKNVVNNMLASISVMGLGIVMWVLFGYSLSFSGNSFGGFLGTLNLIGLHGVGIDAVSPYASTIPFLLFVAFQMMFALITPALITGAVSGRIRFKALFIFLALWSVVVYYPMAHMVWGEGGLLGAAGLGSVDFAGGNVVHISSGVTGLMLCILLGRRHGYEHTSYRIHNIPFVMLGAALLWFGWFGFNAGSALAANGLAAHAFMTTAVSAAAGLVSWMLIDVIKQERPTLIGASTGLVVGLVAITPGAGFVPVWAALLIGLLVSPVCFFGVSVIKEKFKFDDALDAFGCHGIGGIFGGIMTGVFASPAINGAATAGLIYGETRQFFAQVLSILFTIVFALAGTLVCAGITRIFTPLRVSKREEQIGLDMSQHGEVAYPSFTGLD
jgi:Amt family ammonium transporter